jgi:hypothetical protein
MGCKGRKSSGHLWDRCSGGGQGGRLEKETQAGDIDEIPQWDAVVAGVGDWGSCSSCSLHDSIAAERQGVPAIAVMTERCVSAAALMCRVAGMPEYQFAVIGHPISSASDDELAKYARATTRAGTPSVVARLACAAAIGERHDRSRV